MKVTTYDGRTVDVTDARFRFPVNYIGLSRGFTQNYHGGVDCGWNSNYGGRNQPLLTPGKTNRITSIHNDGAWNGGYGNYITMESDGFQVLFAHCLHNSFKVNVGQVLDQGAEVCLMNNSGHSTGDHVHYEVYIPGTTGSKNRVDALPITYVYPGQIVSPNTACKDQIKFLSEPTPPVNVGTPVPRDATVDQLEVKMANLRARSGPYLASTIMGFMNPGIYNITDTVDYRNEASNGYLWYQTHDGYWCAYFEEGETFLPGSTTGDWSTILSLSTDIVSKVDQIKSIAEKNK